MAFLYRGAVCLVRAALEASRWWRTTRPARTRTAIAKIASATRWSEVLFLEDYAVDMGTRLFFNLKSRPFLSVNLLRDRQLGRKKSFFSHIKYLFTKLKIMSKFILNKSQVRWKKSCHRPPKSQSWWTCQTKSVSESISLTKLTDNPADCTNNTLNHAPNGW